MRQTEFATASGREGAIDMAITIKVNGDTHSTCASASVGINLASKDD
jgi:hypothetical protein